jgi:glycosyltransferase involved in cell wall biosynthesis
MDRPLLSVLIVARNEEVNLPDCLKSAAFADEMVVLLDRSTDNSAAIARESGAVVIEGNWPNEGQRRNFGIKQCRGQWILELDADERISPELRDELQQKLKDLPFGHYVVPFHNFIGGVFVQYGWGAYNGVGGKAALFARDAKIWGDGEVHPEITLIGVKGRTTGHIDHYVDADINALFQRLNRYSSAAARDAFAAGKIPGALNTMRRFFSRFIRSYLQLQGYKEGWRGLALALFSGLYPVFTYLKIRELQSRKGS